MKRQYKSLRLRTITDFKKAEALQAKGWKVIQIGWDNVLMEKER
jgi:hypothetical protein